MLHKCDLEVYPAVRRKLDNMRECDTRQCVRDDVEHSRSLEGIGPTRLITTDPRDRPEDGSETINMLRSACADIQTLEKVYPCSPFIQIEYIHVSHAFYTCRHILKNQNKYF